MPPVIRFRKSDILHAAFAITQREGLDAVNARALARELGCSTQPIFRAFHSMDDIKSEMVRMGMDRYAYCILHADTYENKPYLGTGMAYIAFAREETELFRLLFMRDRRQEATVGQTQDQTIEYVIGLLMQRTGFSHEKALRFHRQMWIAVHGIASMIATGYLNITKEEAEQLLTEEYEAMRLLYNNKAN